ncbi:MAG TPA: hypothetical protein VKA70_05500 [Blastocatellia bacterium]|nr:hypothetical protein [Blastocatellia bacterium]
MSIEVKKSQPGAKGLDEQGDGDRLELAATGMEAEFSLVIDGQPVKPEEFFGDPRAFVRGPLMHRQGTSYHIPTGGAVYFDTGVVEVATPVIEIERGCAARAGRSLWEAILFIRAELDEWERRERRDARLVGFSTHYNISFELQSSEQGARRTIEKLALLLCYILPAPVMLLAANRRSTGIGVRPRGNRIEVTADFTPSSSLMIATASLIIGIVREVMTWPSFDLDALDRLGLPVIRDFAPMPHTSRKGWLARFDCYPRNPFAEKIDDPIWEIKSRCGKGESAELCCLRSIAERIFDQFWRPVARVSDPFTFRLIESVLRGRAPSLLELDDRPPEYEDVGRLCRWDNLFPEAELARSRYERVLMRAISGRKLNLAGERYAPVGMRGWSKVIFRREADNSRHVFSIDRLVSHLDDWERG